MKCVNCSKEFENKRVDAKFCSDNCRKNFNRRTTDNSATDNATDKVSVPVTDKLHPDLQYVVDCLKKEGTPLHKEFFEKQEQYFLINGKYFIPNRFNKELWKNC